MAFAPGDILLTNDAYITGSHLNHLTFTVPDLSRRRAGRFLLLHGALARCRRHARRSDDRHFSEGLQIPIVKYARAGVVNQEIHEIIRMNVRLPERAMGDLRAQITAIKTGERRFLELLDRYGQAACAGLHQPHYGSRGSGGARAHARHSRRRL